MDRITDALTTGTRMPNGAETSVVSDARAVPRDVGFLQSRHAHPSLSTDGRGETGRGIVARLVDTDPV
jgi:hypothetical protein